MAVRSLFCYNLYKPTTSTAVLYTVVKEQKSPPSFLPKRIFICESPLLRDNNLETHLAFNTTTKQSCMGAILSAERKDDCFFYTERERDVMKEERQLLSSDLSPPSLISFPPPFLLKCTQKTSVAQDGPAILGKKNYEPRNDSRYYQ